MFKKILPVIALLFVAACADSEVQTGAAVDTKMCKMECCKEKLCKMHGDRSGAESSETKDGEKCQMCVKSEKKKCKGKKKYRHKQ